jgi:hypothetical protein
MVALAICFIAHFKSYLSGFLAVFTQGKTVSFIPIQNNGFSERLKPFRWGLLGGASQVGPLRQGGYLQAERSKSKVVLFCPKSHWVNYSLAGSLWDIVSN